MSGSRERWIVKDRNRGGACLSVGLAVAGMLGLGMGCVFVPAVSLATQGVDMREAGVASAVVNIAQQVGGCIGTALLNTIAAGTTAAYVGANLGRPDVGPESLVHAFSVAAAWTAGVLTTAALLAAVLITARRPARSDRQGGIA